MKLPALLAALALAAGVPAVAASTPAAASDLPP